MQVTGITTVYRTPELLKECYESFRQYYPKLPFIIIDNSTDNSCYHLTEDLLDVDPFLSVIKNEKNEGHGDGMHQAIGLAETPYLFVMDSDVVIRRPSLLEEMMVYMTPSIYGVGWLLNLDRSGRNVPVHFMGEIIKYLYPAFMLLNKSLYYEFPKFTRFGLPPLKAMQKIHDEGLTNKILVDFPVRVYLTHKSGATRARYGDCEDIVEGFIGRKGDTNNPNN
jgi:glycosyltransferase involved in cell wall biosynthesis